MRAHGSWAAALAAQPTQKNFRVAEGDDIVELVLTLLQDSPEGNDGLPASDASSAEPAGWAVSVRYKSAPDTVVFNRTFPTEREARGAFDDLSKASAEVEGLVRQEKLDEARKATESLMEKFKSNSSETPILPTGQA